MTLILVMGMHRSGTSMLTHLLTLSGLFVGEQYDLHPPIPDDNPNGYWENKYGVQINNEILEALGASWDDVSAVEAGWEDANRFDLFIYRMQGLMPNTDETTIVFKDPRNSITLPLWRRAFPDMKMIVCVRNPLEVAESLSTKSNKHRHLSVHEAIILWQKYYEHILQVIEPSQAIWTHYETFFLKPQQELNRILAYLNVNVDAEKIYEAISVIDQSHKHHTIPTDIIRGGYPTPVIAQYYTFLCGLCGPYWHEFVQDEAKQFKILRDYFQEIVVRKYHELETAKQDIAIQTQTLHKTQQQVTHLQSRLAEIQHDRETLRHALTQAQQQVTHLQSQLVETQHDHETLRHALTQVQQITDSEQDIQSSLVNCLRSLYRLIVPLRLRLALRDLRHAIKNQF